MDYTFDDSYDELTMIQKLFRCHCKTPEFKLDYLRYFKSTGCYNKNRHTIPPDHKLHQAIISRDEHTIKRLIREGFDVNDKGILTFTPLHLAINLKDQSVIRLLLKYGADPNHRLRYGNTVLHVVAKTGNVEIAKLVIRYGALVDVRNEFEGTPLHYATVYNQKDMVKFLCDDYDNIDLVDDLIRTPLLSATDLGYTECAEVLLEAGAKTSFVFRRRRISCLHAAAKVTNKNLCNLIAHYETDVDIKLSDETTPLHCAAYRGNAVAGKVLLSYNANAKIKNSRDETALIIAIDRGHYSFVRLLLRYDPDLLAIPSYKHDSWKPIHCAIRSGKPRILSILLKYGANPNETTDCGLTPLHLAVLQEELKMCKSLLSHGAYIDQRDDTDKTPLFYAVKNATPLIKFLIKNGANHRETEVREAFYTCILNQRFYNRKNIMGHIAKLGFTIDPNHEQAILVLQNAVEENILPLVEHLLEKGMDANHNYLRDTGRSCTLLFTAVINRNINMIKLLLEYHADPNINDSHNESPIQYAISRYFFNVAQVLLDHGAIIDGDNYPVLSRIIHCQDISFLQSVLKRYPEMMLTRCNTLAIYDAIECRNEEILEFILEYKLDFTVQNQATHGPLYHAVWHQNKNAVKLILSSKEFVMEDKPILHLAIELGNDDVLKILLKYINNVESLNEEGETPLLFACRLMNCDAIQLLLDKDANVNAKCQLNMTSIMYCAKNIFGPFDNSRTTCMENIMTFCPDLDVKSNSGESVFEIAYESYCVHASRENMNIIKLLLKNYILRYTQEIETITFEKLTEGIPGEVQLLEFTNVFIENCVEELIAMKYIRIEKKISILDVINATSNKLVTYLTNPKIRECLMLFMISNDSDNYSNILQKKIERGVKRIQLYNDAIAALQEYTLDCIPYCAGYHICSFLSNRDLEALVGTSMQRYEDIEQCEMTD